MKLYTSAVRLKEAVNGNLAPMTPIPDDAKVWIDPSFTINGDGHGGIVEDEVLGLRCPVRGCGEWHHRLSHHAAMKHRALGGPDGLKILMGIPSGASLVSESESDAMRVRSERNPTFATRDTADHARRFVTRQSKDRAQKTSVASKKSTGRLNVLDHCFAQVSNKIVDLETRIGRSPSKADCIAVYGHPFYHAVINHFGTWNAAKANCGLSAYRFGKGDATRLRREQVIESYAAWHEVHGDLPDSHDAVRPTRTPYIQTPTAVKKAMGTESWSEAMQRIASILSIYGGRYGLPVKASA